MYLVITCDFFLLDPECSQHVRPADPLTEPGVTTSSFLSSHNDDTTTQRNVPPISAVSKDESTTQNQHTNVEVIYMYVYTSIMLIIH